MRLFENLDARVNRIFAWADRVQRRHGVLGFPYAVIKKYGDDDGGREAALMTYYGFLSIFPLLLLGVAVLSRVLADNPELRQRLITATIPAALRSTVENSLTALPTSTVPFIVGLIGLLFSGTGVVFSASQTLNHVAAVPRRLRAGFWSRYVRVFGMLAALLLGALAVGALTVVVTALPGVPEAERAAAVLGSAVVIFAVLLFGARLLLARPAPVRALWPAAVLGAAAVTLALNLGAPLLARLVTKAGPVYGSFATVAGMFALLYLVNQALVYAAEIAAVRYARLWPRALDVNRPTAADVRVMTLLAREQERIPAARIGFRLVSRDSSTAGKGPPGGDLRWLSRAPHSPASGFIVAGAVWVSKTTPTHITAKAIAATASTPASGLKRSSNSHTLRAMLTIGSTITKNGWETRSGPTCSATCCRMVPAAPPTARAYTGQRVNIPATPNWVRVSVVALMIVASSAQMVADAAAYRAARRPGDPQCAAAARTAAPAPHATAATIQC